MGRNAKVRVAEIAVVGVGYWGKNLARNFNQLGALKVLCDENSRIEAECHNNYPDVNFVRNFDQVLSDPEIRGIALATPATSHFELAKAALNAGKDVLVEKPLATAVRDGEELLAVARSRGRILMVGHILQYHPAIIKLQELIDRGILGKVHYIYSNRLNIGKIRTEENILWSFAPHDISVILGLLREMPLDVICRGGGWLNQGVADVTLSHFTFSSGVQAHIFVSWLHPVKEQRLVIVGSDKMAVFDDTADNKLTLYPHKVEWRERVPLAVKANGQPVAIANNEPLKSECEHFLDSIYDRVPPLTDGEEGLKVLRVLDACQRSLQAGGKKSSIDQHKSEKDALPYFVHESAYLDEGAQIGRGTKIWHFSHIMKAAQIGERCIVGQNVNIDGDTHIGNNVKIQNNVSVYSGVTIEDDVFLGPSCVLTNVSNPRSQVNRHSLYETTVLRRGATIGANATVVCGVTVGRYAFVGAGSVVTKNVPDFALVVGNPARQVGWMSRHGHRLSNPDRDGIMRCPETGYRYRECELGILRCLDLDDNAPLPEKLSIGTKSYRQIKEESSYEYSASRS